MFIISLAFDFIYHQPATVTIFRWLLAANTLLLMITFEQLFKKKKTSLKIVSHSVWQTANSSACLALTF